MNIDLPPQYDPKSVEKAIYQKWLDSGAFHAVPDARPPEQRFSVVIPPPNVTGALHLGHAINGTIQDVLTRYHRMKGDNTLWMPGIDHAGIATQAVVEKTIFEKEKKSRHDLGREELVRRIWEWKEQFGTRILAQLASIGCSCDWQRTRFTLDDICAKAVREAFFKMFKDGLIFRGKRLVNWDAHLQTAVADDEIYHETVKGQMTSIKYPVAKDTTKDTAPDGNPGLSQDTEYLIVATTRPETMLGDTAVAVHPDDPRYKHLIGQHVIIPLVGRRIPIIADGQLVDPAFGTGVVKVTPAHDPNDYATGLRHNLEQINLLTPDGKMNENGAGEFLGKKYSYAGLKFATAARKQVLADLESLGLIAEAKPHEHEVGHSDRSKTPIEPYLSDQWFVRMGDIAGGTLPDGRVSEPLASSEALPHSNVPEKPGGSETRPSGSVPPPPHSTALAYFITFHTYATWLHGETPGSVDPENNIPGTPFIPPDVELMNRDQSKQGQSPLVLSLAQRQAVLQTLREVADHRGWKLVAANVRETHVHAVLEGPHAPERMMNDFKSYATRRMREAGLLAADASAWSRHGSTRYLWQARDVAAAIRYSLDAQGENSAGTFWPPQTLPDGRVSEPLGRSETQVARSVLPHAPSPQPLAHKNVPGKPSGSETRPSGSVGGGRSTGMTENGITLADGTRVSGLAQAAIDAVTSGKVKITPDRYAKGYVDWLSQKRDWCISRQLWWGHRIPVWSRILDVQVTQNSPGLQTPVRGLVAQKTVSDTSPFSIGDSSKEFISRSTAPVILPDGRNATQIYFCVAPGHSEIEQQLEAEGCARDPDVLDTWFSSALWPLSTLGWPDSTTRSETRPSGSVAAESNTAAPSAQTLPDGRVSEPHGIAEPNGGSDGMPPEPNLLPYFYPTSLLSTGRDILTLWVARMVMFGLYCGGDVPFKSVYIHTTIQDGEGRPMKKTLGNGLDPVDVVASHGADAMRFTLASMSTETQDVRMPLVKDPKTGRNTSLKFDIGRNFANKIWNAARYILGNIDEKSEAGSQKPQAAALEDRWIFSRLNATIQAAEAAINAYRFADYAQSLYQFFWTDLCDWYLEISKARIKSGDAAVQSVLRHCLETSLKLLHPLMPFITEELWSKLPGRSGLLIAAPWPGAGLAQIDPGAEAQITIIQGITTAIREIQNRYPAARGKNVILQPRDAATQEMIDASRSIIEPLAAVKIAENSPAAQKPENAATALLPECQIFIPGVIDKAAESAKLQKRQAELHKFIDSSRGKLANESFVQKAPAKIIQGLRDQLAKYEEELAALEKNLAELSAA